MSAVLYCPSDALLYMMLVLFLFFSFFLSFFRKAHALPLFTLLPVRPPPPPCVAELLKHDKALFPALPSSHCVHCSLFTVHCPLAIRN